MSYLKDGFRTRVSFAANPSVKLRIKAVTPVGLDGGGPIPDTTMENSTVRTDAPKSLITVTGGQFEAKYDPAVYTEILSLINVNNLITNSFPDGSAIYYWGWLNSFQPNQHTEGGEPLANCTFHASNRNASDVETAPTYSATTTTSTTTTTTT